MLVDLKYVTLRTDRFVSLEIVGFIEHFVERAVTFELLLWCI